MHESHRQTCNCLQGYHYSGLVGWMRPHPHLYLTWLVEHCGADGAREYVRDFQLPELTRTNYRRKRNAAKIKLYRRFVGERGK